MRNTNLKFKNGYGSVHGEIRKLLKAKKVLRRVDVERHLFSIGIFEGDTGRRLREMEDVLCSPSKAKVNGKVKPVWLYSLTE